MNLYDLVQRVFSVTDRNPNTTGYRNEVVNLLNDTYIGLCTSYRWLFLQARVLMQVYPDHTTGTVTVTNGSRTVTGVGTGWGRHMDGHQFIGPDGSTYGIAFASGLTMYLEGPYNGPNVAGAAYTVRFFAYAMPADCVEPVNLMSRTDDRGRVHYIDTETEANNYLDRDDVGDPFAYLSAGMRTTRTVDPEFTAAAGPGAGTLVAGTEYGYRVTVVYRGTEGPPSKEATFTATATGEIDLAGIEDLRVGGVSVGYEKRLYRRTGATGPYKLLATLVDSATTYADTGAVAPNPESAMYEHGQVFTVWFYPRPSTAKMLELWYQVRPGRLDKDQDVPLLPQEFHSLLWRMAGIDVLRKYNQPTTSLERAVQEQLDAMRRRYLSRSDRRWRMGNGWEGDIGSLANLRYGTATID